jgi:hypothetical protein
MDTSGHGIKSNDREPGQQAFDKGFASAALHRVGRAINGKTTPLMVIPRRARN